MPFGGLLTAGLAPIAGSLIGGAVAGGDRDEANAARQKALEAILGISAPSIEQQRVALGKHAVVGQLTPEMEGAINQDPSQMAGISTDPRLRDAQMKALETMQGLGSTGLSAEDRVALMDIRNRGMGDSQAGQAAIMQNLAARGMAGGGQELAARMMANQGAANVASQEGMDVAAQAQAKALQALMNSGQLGGQIRQEEFNEKSDIAKAQDAIAQFNTANRQNVGQRNVSAKNTAQASNLGAAQSVADTNVDLGNKQELYNKGLYQQNFQNEMQRANAVAGGQNQAAAGHDASANATQGMWSGIGQGVGSAASAIGKYNPTAAKPTVSSQYQSLLDDEEAKKKAQFQNAGTNRASPF